MSEKPQRDVPKFDPAQPSGAHTAAPTSQNDGLGDFGLALTRYHVGDAMGAIGLLVSVITAFLAQSARRAAKRALSRRDGVEVATLLSDLAAHLREVTSLLAADDWSGISDRIDRAVHVSNRIATTAISNEESKVLETVRVELRAIQKAILGIKDPAKHGKRRQRQVSVIIDLIDSVEIAQTKRLKNDNFA